MDNSLLSSNASLLNSQGILIRSGLSVANYKDNTGEYIRVGYDLHWKKDMIIQKDKLTCLASGFTIILNP